MKENERTGCRNSCGRDEARPSSMSLLRWRGGPRSVVATLLRTSLWSGLLALLALGLAVGLRVAHADDSINAKLLALFPQFDADHNKVLAPEEQARAVASVRKQFGDLWGRQVQSLFKAAAGADGIVTRTIWQ